MGMHAIFRLPINLVFSMVSLTGLSSSGVAWTHEPISMPSLGLQTRNLSLAETDIAGSLSLLMNGDKVAVISLLLPTSGALIDLVDPSGKRWPWDESRDNPACQKEDNTPFETAPNFVVTSYRLYLQNPPPGEWKVAFRLPKPLGRKWFTPIQVQSDAPLSASMLIPTTELLTGESMLATLAVVDGERLVTDVQIDAKLVWRGPETGYEEQPVTFTPQVLDPGLPKNLTAKILGAKEGTYFLNAMVRGRNSVGPWERYASASFDVRTRTVVVPGTFKSEVR